MFRIQRLVAGVTLVCAAPLCFADVLTFDDLTTSAFFTSNYQGFKFGTNAAATNAWFHSVTASPYYVPHSGAGYVATDATMYDNSNPYEATQPISNATPFVFQGAWFTGAGAVGYQLYLGDALVSSSMPSSALGASPTFVSSRYAGLVTSVVVMGTQGYYAMDDFTYAPVPEPASRALLLAGVICLAAGALRRRRQR